MAAQNNYTNPASFAQLQQQGQARPPQASIDNGFASFNGQPTGGGIRQQVMPQRTQGSDIGGFGGGTPTMIRNEPDPHDLRIADQYMRPPSGGQGGGGWAGNWSGPGGWGSGGQPSVDESRGVPSGRPPSTIPQQPSQQGGAPPPQTMRPAGPPGSGWGSTPGQMPQINGQPDLSGAYQHQYNNAGVPSFGGGPQSNFTPGSYKGPGNFDAYQQSNFKGPQVQAQGHFTAPQQGQQVDNRTMQSVLEALGNPSRYGSQQAQDTFNVLNHSITQQGNADYGRINEDMARRGIYASTTAGGRLGDLATNLNQQRSDMATNIATDQARQYQGDRASAIGQALGYGGQQFNQGLAGFGANQQAGQQRYDQQLGAGQFGLQQNAQNFGQQYQQYGANQQEAMNKYNSGYQNAQFGLNQNNQNYNQGANTYGLNLQGNAQGFGQGMAALGGLQNFGQAQFNNQLQQSQFNSDQDYRNTQLMLNMLGIQ